MMPSCTTPVPDETLLDYLGGDLAPGAEGDIEAHLFGCADCSRRADRLVGLVASVAAVIPPVLSPARLARLEREGRVEAQGVLHPGEKVEAFYPTAGRLLLHRLSSPGLGEAERVDLRLTSPGTALDAVIEAITVDRERNEVLVACQSHFAETFPREVVFTLESVASDERRELARYTVHHRMPPPEA